jgi:hypothetical protein
MVRTVYPQQAKINNTKDYSHIHILPHTRRKTKVSFLSRIEHFLLRTTGLPIQTNFVIISPRITPDTLENFPLK